MRGTKDISQICPYCITGNRAKDKGRGTPRGLIRKRLDWFDSKANNATSCVGKSRGTVKAAAWLNLNSPPPPTLPTTKLICKGRVDRANRNSAVQISYPLSPGSDCEVASDRLFDVWVYNGMKIYLKIPISGMSFALGTSSRKVAQFPRCGPRRMIFSPRGVDIDVPSQ